MDITAYFPALIDLGVVESYTYNITTTAPKTIPAGASNVSVIPRTIFKKRGYAVNFLIGANNPLLSITFVVDDRRVTGNFNDLKDQNLPGITHIPFVVAYNPTFKFYEGVLEANFPFSNNFNILVSNPTGDDIQIVVFESQLYLFKPGFYTMLSKLVNGKTDILIAENIVIPVTEKLVL